MSTAAQLKDEGNKLFLAKQYAQAQRVYAQAIEKDPSNPILYANRAACALNLQKYGEAESDAAKSTELNPEYTKAWARLATAQQALGNAPGGILSWEKAIATLPANPGSAELKLKEQYEANLTAVKKAQTTFDDATRHGQSPLVYKEGTAMPWQIAKEILPSLFAAQGDGPPSSAWLVIEAYNNFKEGVDSMNQVRATDTPAGQGYFGQTGAIESISNGILMDERVFHINQPDFIDKYNKQVMLEMSKRRAWNSGEAQEVVREAPIRLQKEGWDSVRPAISLTVRGYLLKGFILGGLKGDRSIAEQLHSQAVAILEWGAQNWPGVSYQNKGAVFKPSFIRGVKSMRLNSYMQALSDAMRTKASTNHKHYSLQEFRELAQELRDDCEGLAVDAADGITSPGFRLAFYVYPAVQAASCLALYHKMLSRATKDAYESGQNLSKAANFYVEAADKLPEDDEQRVWYLNSALICAFEGHAPVQATLPLMKRIRLEAPKMQKLWANSTLQRGGRDMILQKTFRAEEQARTALEAGDLDMDTPFCPADFFQVD